MIIEGLQCIESHTGGASTVARYATPATNLGASPNSPRRQTGHVYSPQWHASWRAARDRDNNDNVRESGSIERLVRRDDLIPVQAR
jgi:hypothetical protein